MFMNDNIKHYTHILDDMIILNIIKTLIFGWWTQPITLLNSPLISLISPQWHPTSLPVHPPAQPSLRTSAPVCLDGYDRVQTYYLTYLDMMVWYGMYDVLSRKTNMLDQVGHFRRSFALLDAIPGSRLFLTSFNLPSGITTWQWKIHETKTINGGTYGKPIYKYYRRRFWEVNFVEAIQFWTNSQ